MSNELIDAVNAAYAGGEFQHAKGAATLIPDELVRRIAFCGTPSQAEAKLAWLRDEGVGGVSIFPLGPDRRGSIARFAEFALVR
jgi:5,10-methylenetetrahydromethanopterin reductase